MRNTLYLWDGIIEAAGEWPNGGGAADVKTDDFGRPRGKFPLKWKGHVLRLADCPDSRSVGVPKAQLFSTSLSSQFNMEGAAVEQGDGRGRDDKNPRCPITYLATLNVSDEEREILLPTMRYWDVRSDWDSKPTVEAVVVGCGRNSLGPFIEAGWVQGVKDCGHSNRIHLTLGRRYIRADDKRARWSLSELKNVVVPDVIRLRESVPPDRQIPPAVLPPWRCHALHSDESFCCESMIQCAAGGKRKHEEENDIA